MDDFIVVLFLRAELDFFHFADLDFDLDFEAFPFGPLAVTDPFTGANFEDFTILEDAEGFLVKDFFGDLDPLLLVAFTGYRALFQDD